MRNYQSLEEISEVNCLLENIKKEYEYGIQPILKDNYSGIYRNPHKLPKLKKIQINRGLGLSAQNSNILKKSMNTPIDIVLTSHRHQFQKILQFFNENILKA